MSLGETTRRTGRSFGSRLLRWVGIVVGALIALVVIALGALWGASGWKLNRQFSVPTESVAVSTDPAMVARGQHLAFAITKCMGCHGIDLGGTVLTDSPALGRLAA